jgi:16S rRNA processing protein RimM
MSVVVGHISKVHGVRGEVVVVVLTEFPERFAEGSVLASSDGRSFTIQRTRDHHGRLLVKFAEVPDREAAEALRGLDLVVDEADLPELPEGRWWPSDIEGCEVVTEDGQGLGTVAEIIFTPANDVWAVRAPDGREVLIPVIDDVLISVDVEAKRIVVREVPGLLE